ncbi:MAG: ABC transporter permease [Flexilinea sp.]
MNTANSIRKNNWPTTMRLRSIIVQYAPFIVLVLLIAWNCTYTKNFAHLSTLWNAMFQCAPVMVISMGMMLVIASGGIDISVGSMMAGAGTLAAFVMSKTSIQAGVLCGIAFGIIGGILNGVLVGKFRIQPMIVTLSTMYIFRGIAKLITNGTIIGTKQPDFNSLSYIKLWVKSPIQMYVFIVIIIIIAIIERKTRFGTYVQACGDNKNAAYFAGISTAGVLIITYTLCGLLSSFAGLMEIALSTGADPYNLGLNNELDAIAAVAIGGTPMSGGKPRVAGTIAGVFILRIATIMVNMNNVAYAYSLTIKAGILILAILLQRVKINEA